MRKFKRDVAVELQASPSSRGPWSWLVALLVHRIDSSNNRSGNGGGVYRLAPRSRAVFSAIVGVCWSPSGSRHVTDAPTTNSFFVTVSLSTLSVSHKRNNCNRPTNNWERSPSTLQSHLYIQTCIAL